MSDLALPTNGGVIACPECGGSGLMTYQYVGGNCPCMTCSDGLYERGTGTIPAPAAKGLRKPAEIDRVDR